MFFSFTGVFLHVFQTKSTGSFFPPNIHPPLFVWLCCVFRPHCLNRWERREGSKDGVRSSKTMACDVAAAEIRGIGSIPEDSASAVPMVVVLVVQPCAPDEHRDVCSFTEQSAADEPPAMGTRRSGQGNDSMTDQQEQTSHGICSQATQTIVDLTKSDASDGMLLDGLRTILQKRQERKQERSVLKEQRNKILVDKQGYFNCFFFY